MTCTGCYSNQKCQDKLKNKWANNKQGLRANRSMSFVCIWGEYNRWNAVIHTRIDLLKKSLQNLSIRITSKRSKQFNFRSITLACTLDYRWSAFRNNLNLKRIEIIIHVHAKGEKSTSKACNRNSEKLNFNTSGGASNDVKWTTFPSVSTSFTMKSEYLYQKCTMIGF